jgi:hypothetical protein
MSSAGTDVIERSEPARQDRSCSILLLDDLFFSPMEFSKNKSRASNKKILMVHTHRRRKTLNLFQKGTVRRGEEVRRKVIKLRIQVHPCYNQSMNRAGLRSTHAAILNGGA